MDDLITTRRLSMPVLDLPLLRAIATDPASVSAFRIPPGWPDAVDRPNVERWITLAEADGGHSPWRARALVTADGTMVGHAGFHQPPVPVEEALDDPTFVGTIAPSTGGATEIGYAVLPDHRGNGYATEAANGLIEWGRATGRLSTVIACVRPDNTASLAVLRRVGGFSQIGRCSDDGVPELVFRRDA